MARINLLPWREELRAQQKQEFLMSILLAIVATVFILIAIHIYIEGIKNYQTSRNQLIQDEITVLDRKIKEIKDIEAKKNRLLTKIEVIQELQESRPQIVHLFEELAKTTPEGIILTKFVLSGNGLTFNGKAQSNARVSAYMRSIEASKWLQDPRLNVIQAKNKTSKSQLSDFTMLATQAKDKPENKEGG